MPLTEGTRLGPYEVIAAIGAGGMGEVYKALDSKLGREVAIKVLPEAFAENKERLARFGREARLLASLNHPNIATLFDLQKSDGTHFLVLELVPGETLAERIKRGPIPVDEALPLFKQIAEGLEAAHEKGVIHRDLKPANIKVTPEGKVKVLDFGLAKAMAGEAPTRELSESPTLTRDATETGVLLGTAPYMSPEQARGKPVDKRTDIWAFGCCFYEALTGKAAFLGDTVADTIAKIVEREPDWQALPEVTPAFLRIVLRRCLRKEVSGRLHDVADVRIEIEEVMAEPTLPGEEPFGVSNTQKWRAAVPWLIAILGVGLAIWSFLRDPAPGLEASFRYPLATLPIAVKGDASSVALSPDGTKLAFVAEQDGTRRLYIQKMGEMEATLIAGTENGVGPFFSPDGQWVGFVDRAERKLKKVSLLGGLPLPLCDVHGYLGTHWGSDDTIFFGHVAETSGGGIWRVSASGGTPEHLISPRAEESEWAVGFPEVLPGGKEVLFSAMDGSMNTLGVEVQSLETGDRKSIIEGGNAAHYVPTGHLAYAEAGSLFAAPFDLARLELTGPPVPVVEGVRMSFGDAHFGFSGNGSLVYVPGGEPEPVGATLVWVDRSGEAEPIIDLQRPFVGPKLSPDGKRIAMWTRGGNPQVWVYEMKRGTLTPLTSEGQNFYPIWSPDGKRVAFPSMRSGSAPNLFLQSADGSGSAEQLTTSEYAQQPYSWSPDGKLLVFQQGSDPDTGWDIWVLPMKDGLKPEPFLKTPFNEIFPALSPDGRWLAYVSDVSGRNEIYVTPFPGPGGRWQISADGGDDPAWAPSGRELFYLHGRANLDPVMVVDIVTRPEFRPGRPRVLFDGPYDWGKGFGRNYDVTSDGQRFLMIKSVDESTPQQINVIRDWFEELKRLVPTK